jgi:hypothetical protein
MSELDKWLPGGCQYSIVLPLNFATEKKVKRIEITLAGNQTVCKGLLVSRKTTKQPRP